MSKVRRGVVLCGGTGSRLGKLVSVTNKHLVGVYDRPMVYFPLQLLAAAGIEEVCLVSGGNYCGQFIQLLKNGEELGFKSIQYKFQEGAGGIAAALGLAENFAAGEPIVVHLGDNIFIGQEEINNFISSYSGRGAKVLLKQVPDASRFGVAEILESTLQLGRPENPTPYTFKVIRSIIEKPENPPSNLAVTGLYIYDSQIFEIIKTLKPSARAELEISDANNEYIMRGGLDFQEFTGSWIDAGKPESLLRAANLIAEKEQLTETLTAISRKDEDDAEFNWVTETKF